MERTSEEEKKIQLISSLKAMVNSVNVAVEEALKAATILRVEYIVPLPCCDQEGHCADKCVLVQQVDRNDAEAIVAQRKGQQILLTGAQLIEIINADNEREIFWIFTTKTSE